MERERLARPLDRGVPPLTLPSPREAVARVRARGVVGSARGAARLAARELRGAARRRRLARRPLAVGPGELERALGAPPGAILGGRVLAAMPTVARWERALERGDVDRRRLLERADAVAAHRFDLLGSGPTHLGGEIDWQLDFKAGRRWPLVHISRVPVAYADGSDIKVPWELSRCQHLPLLAAAAHVEPDGPYLRELGAQLTSWIDANPVEFGTNWLIAMEPAIRAANWIAALALVRDLGHAEPWFTRTLESLLLHGRFVRTHLEDGPVRGNHFLSNVVGLLVLAALFADGEDGREWREWGVPALERELFHQVRADGVAHEASIPYHRLVAELFVCGTHAADALAPGRLSSAYRERLSSMLDFTRDVTRGDGLAPLIGDSDDGRFLPLDT
ncbi:MAG TPA: heparinase II/III family protein, partial [Gaiellaceae bacterium]|nr:heparinase II/III family protein [Gaiellaceae bacterium]